MRTTFQREIDDKIETALNELFSHLKVRAIEEDRADELDAILSNSHETLDVEYDQWNNDQADMQARRIGSGSPQA